MFQVRVTTIKPVVFVLVILIVSFYLVSNMDTKSSNQVLNTIKEHINKVPAFNRTFGDAAKTVSCENFLKERLFQTVTDEVLSNLYQLCFNEDFSTSPPETFDKLFSQEIFQNVTCPKMSISYNKGRARPVVALASFPGSGNTWLRILIEQLTGIHSGSIYMDGLCNNVLVGSRICPDSRVFVIKTHRPSALMERKGCKTMTFSSAVYILRNPYDAVLAEYNREKAGKVAVADKTQFKSSTWLAKVQRSIGGWSHHAKYWLSVFPKPVHIAVYEHIKTNELYELYQMSKFLDFPVTLARLWCIRDQSMAQNTFYRKKPTWLRSENLYTNKQKKLFNSHIQELIKAVYTRPEIQSQLLSYILD